MNKTLVYLERLAIVSELTGKLRGRVFNYTKYIGILSEGTDLPKQGRRP